MYQVFVRAAQGPQRIIDKSKVEVPQHLRLGLNLAAYKKFVKEELWKVGFDPRSTSIRSRTPSRGMFGQKLW